MQQSILTQQTDKLFYTDSHMLEFDAVVLACEKSDKDEGLYRIVLDRTAFFPEGGGQQADTGFLGDACVKDVREKEGTICHICDRPVPVGETVHGRLDYDKRFDRMQNHTGEHIVSGLVHRHFGYENVGFHLGTDVTMDFDGELSGEDLLRIEREANGAVVKNLPVIAEFPDREKLAAMEYRSKIELEGQVRIVTVPGYDCCACCAPHVAFTGEIGMIKLLNGQKYKGGTRVTMVCGFRALSDYNQKAGQIAALSVLLSAKQTEVAAAAGHMKEELAACKGKLTELRQQLFTYRAAGIDKKQPCVCLFEQELNGNELRTLVNLCMEKCSGICIALSGDDASGYHFVAGSRTKDMREFGGALNEAFQGRGGGKPEMIQGSIKGSRTSIEEWILHKAAEN